MLTSQSKAVIEWPQPTDPHYPPPRTLPQVPIADGFRLFATQALSSSSTAEMTRTKVLSSFNLWAHVVVYSLSLAEMAHVVAQQNPSIPRFFVTSFLSSLNALAGSHARFRLAFRDVLKWGRRIGAAMPRLHFHDSGYMPLPTKIGLFEETVDAFCSHLPRREFQVRGRGQGCA